MKRQASFSKKVVSELEDMLDSKLRKLEQRTENTEMKSGFQRLLEANEDKMKDCLVPPGNLPLLTYTVFRVSRIIFFLA